VPSSVLASQCVSNLNIPVAFTLISKDSYMFLHLIIIFSKLVTNNQELVSSNLCQMLTLNDTYFTMHESGKTSGLLKTDISQDPSAWKICCS